MSCARRPIPLSGYQSSMFSHDWSMLGPSSTLVCAPMLAGAARSQNAGLADASLFSVCLLLCRPDASDTMRRARSGAPVHIWPSLDEDVGRGHGCCTHLAVSVAHGLS